MRRRSVRMTRRDSWSTEDRMDKMTANERNRPAAALQQDAMTLEVVRDFHRRMAAMIEAVQTGIWKEGVHELLGYATDYAFGQQRGVQTLVLKSRHRSA